MPQICDILVVGAGPAGLAAGIAAASGGSVYVLERNSEPGRKLLLSGSGQCNFTHAGSIAGFLSHYGTAENGSKARFVKPALFSFSNTDAVQFFTRKDIAVLTRKDGKVFPESLSSKDILDALLDELKRQGGILKTEAAVVDIQKTDTGFSTETCQGMFTSRKLIIAVGGCSYPLTGSRGDGFRFAERLGHKIVAPKSALTPVYIQNYPFADSAGIAFRNRTIFVFRNKKKFAQGRGDVLLTHCGLSGPGILDLSRFIEPGDDIQLVLHQNTETIPTLLTGKKTLKNALLPLEIPEQFLTRLLTFLGIPPEQSASEVPRSVRQRLERALNALPLTVEKVGTWNEAMSTAGGVALEDIERQTMQSRIVPGLFFCGEVLDVDGDTGGYNIQFALSSGFLAGKSSALDSI